MSRRDKTRGPYMEPEQYKKIKKLSDKYDDMTVGETLDSLVDATLNEQGDIIVNPVSARFKEK
jgi:hypothetical protein